MKEASKTVRNGDRKKKVIATTAMLLVAATVLIAVSYAWLVLSIAPEVSGISTQIGANGALEIALLNNVTHADLSQISSGVGSNVNSWGNLVDLNADTFGLANITLYPARLNIEEDGQGGYIVKDNYLLVPTYDHKGQVVSLNGETYGVTYDAEKKAFAGDLGNLGFGVRGYGTSSSVSVQAAALALAKANVSTYTSNAKNNAATTLNGNTNALLGLYAKKDGDITNADIEVLGKMISGLEKSSDYIDKALRQGLIAYAAAKIADKDEFNVAKDAINSGSLSDLVKKYSSSSAFETWVEKLDDLNDEISTARSKYNSLVNAGGNHAWEQVTDVLNGLINLDNVILSDGTVEKAFSEWSTGELTGLGGKNVEMALRPGSGAFATISDFVGNYSTSVQPMGINIQITTYSSEKPSYLESLSSALVKLNAAGSSSNVIELTDLYGYAIDLAFRCNAPLSELLLQTNPVSRVSQDDADDETPGSGASTMGAGSYMEFSISSENYTTDQAVTLMDAIRVAFIDDSGKVLGIAKLNTSNRTIADDVITAPLYLYEFSLVNDTEAGGNILKMGERRGKGYNDITKLDKNVTKAVTTLVWLDGDVVDNTMVSADSETSLSGVLNLQFSSSADLIPANNAELSNLTPDKKTLEEKITAFKETYEAGQKTEKKNYTTASWDEFTQAYEFAQKVYIDATASEDEVYRAIIGLKNIKLKEISFEELDNIITEYRAIAGETEAVARYLVKDEKNKCYTLYRSDSGTTSSLTINSVDNTRAFKTSDDGTKVPYTAYSWEVFAQAIYEAEALVLGKEYTTQEAIDQAITTMENAHTALMPAVTKIAYDFDGEIFYCTKTNDDADKYGTWFDAQSQKITSDLTILKLESLAETAQGVTVDGVDYLNVEKKDKYADDDEVQGLAFYPNFHILYPEIMGDQIVAIRWSVDKAGYELAMTASQRNLLTSLMVEARTLNLTTDSSYTAAENLLSNSKPTIGTARTVINNLMDCIDVKKAKDSKDYVAAEYPTGFSYADSVSKYEVNQRQMLFFTGADPTGTVTMTATVLTEKGFVFDVEIPVTIYAPGTLTPEKPQDVEITVDGNKEIKVEFITPNYQYKESITKYSWSSDNKQVVTVNSKDGTCTITGVKEGSTTVRVSVYTKEGNIYTKEFKIIVTEKQ